MSIKVLTDSDFDESLPPGIALVDFWAPWCTPCLVLAPVLEELSEELQGRLAFAKINVEENRQILAKYNIRSIPCLIMFRDRAEAGRIAGHNAKDELRAELEKYF
jgi:thioredoxin 1